jgi:rhodanese-related sulfurtransferase
MVKQVEGETLKQWMEDGERMILVDGRAGEDYAIDHLPGAVSLLNAEVRDRDGTILPYGVKVVVYSKDADCPAGSLVLKCERIMRFFPAAG